MDVVVVGAGTFGASLAWWLARLGEQVTLVDQFEPGDRRASSGGETRLYRCAHGADADYTAMARRARTLWRELEDESGEELLVECGMAWFAQREDGWEADSERSWLHRASRLSASMSRARRASTRAFAATTSPSCCSSPRGVRAQRSVEALAAQAVAHGARIVRGWARPDGTSAVLEDSTRLDGDIVVWACGPWLARLFGDLVSISITRQELLFFDGGPAWRAPGLPGWCDYDRARYGTADMIHWVSRQESTTKGRRSPPTRSSWTQ